MKLTAIQSAVVASGILLAGSLASSPVLAQSGSEKGQRAESAKQQGQGRAEQEKGQAERMREMKQVQDEQARERAQEQQERMREQGEANADAANQNRKADPANKGSEQGQAQKQEKSRAWWNFWGD